MDNTTVYDRLPVKAPQADIMEVDVVNRTEAKQEVTGETKITITPAEQNAADTTGGKATAEAKEEEAEKTLDLDDLYSVFWSLQNYFSRPTQLFDPSNLKHFKEGLQATIAKFQEIQRDQDSRASVKASEEPKQGTKRKWEAEEETLIGEINPKYLTSRDLFALEVRCEPWTRGFHIHLILGTAQRSSIPSPHSCPILNHHRIPPLTHTKRQGKSCLVN